MNTKRLTATILTAVLLAAAGCTNDKKTDVLDDEMAQNASGSGQASTERFGEVIYPGWEDPAMARTAAYSGRALLHHLHSAQQALDLGQLDKGKKLLSAAGNLAAGIRTMMPFSVLVDQIKDAKGRILSTDSTIQTDSFLPIYRNLDVMELYTPELATKSRDKIENAENQAKKGKHKEAVATLDEVAADISTTQVYLPVLTVQQRIDNALAALDSDPSDVIEAQEQIDIALSSLVGINRGTLVVKHK